MNLKGLVDVSYNMKHVIRCLISVLKAAFRFHVEIYQLAYLTGGQLDMLEMKKRGR